MKIYNETQAKSIFGFEDLRLYERTVDLSVYVHTLADKFPKNGRELGDKLVQGSLNMAVNVTTGASFPDKRDFITHLRDIKLRIRECVIYITVAKRLEYITEEEEIEVRDILMGVLKMSSAFISSILKNINESPSDIDMSKDSIISNF